MKRSISLLFLCFSLCVLFAHAQQLKLKKGQKLSYELLKIDDYGTNKYVYFDEYEFVVTAVNKDGYVISASKPRSIVYDDRKIVDSQLPLEEQPKPMTLLPTRSSAGQIISSPQISPVKC